MHIRKQNGCSTLQNSSRPFVVSSPLCPMHGNHLTCFLLLKFLCLFFAFARTSYKSNSTIYKLWLFITAQHIWALLTLLRVTIIVHFFLLLRYMPPYGCMTVCLFILQSLTCHPYVFFGKVFKIFVQLLLFFSYWVLSFLYIF